MRKASCRYSPAALSAFLALLCTFSTAAAANRTRPAWWRDAPAGVKRSVYVGQAAPSGNGTVLAFKPNNRADAPPFCSIPGQSFVDTDIGSDAAGNVYVPNFEGGSVTVYAPGCGAPIASFADPYGAPQGVTVRRGIVYVQDTKGVAVCTLSGCTSRLTDPSMFEQTGAAVDAKGNVWGAYYATNGGISLIVWPHGMMPGHIVSGYTASPTPGAIFFDAQDNLVTIVSHFAFAFTHACTVNRATCAQTGSFVLQGRSMFGVIARGGDSIQVTDLQHDAVDVFAYPAFKYEYSYSNGLTQGSIPEGITQAP